MRRRGDTAKGRQGEDAAPSRRHCTRRGDTARLRVPASFTVILLAAYLSGCAGKQSALDPAGLQADRLDDLWWFMFWTCAAVFVLVIVALIYAVVKGRQHAKATDAEGATRPQVGPEPEKESRMTRVIAGAVGVTVVILFVMLIYDFATARALLSLGGAKEPITIQVIGHQWWWSVRYDDAVPSRVIETANEIHFPVGQPVLLKTTSTDVIHSFWAPNLHGKKDMIPGQQTITWFQADRPGVYRGQCAEFCGYQHAKMAFVVVVEPLEDFNAWLDSQRAAARTPATDEEAQGQQVFLSSTCVMCHTVRGTPAASRFGPDLTHLASRQSIAAGMLPNTREHLSEWITKPQEIKPGSRMPPNPLEPEQLGALLTYLESLK